MATTNPALTEIVSRRREGEAASTASAELESLVRSSYAHNSRLYEHLHSGASLDVIVDFLEWDAHQPAFNVYLRRWLPKAPASVRTALIDHIGEEEHEEHSLLFSKMMADLVPLRGGEAPEFDGEVLDALNYTFSEQCAAERSFHFFAGGFFATEIMSAKRCRQLHEGLLRLGMKGATLRYLEVHSTSDQRHVDEVKRRFIEPLLAEDPDALAKIREGVADRLSRSGRYLRWYDAHRLS